MSNEPSKNPKYYRTAGILFSIGGLIFIIVAAVSNNIGAFLAPGIALVIIGIALRQYGRKLMNATNKTQN